MENFDKYKLLYEERHHTIMALLDKLVKSNETNSIHIARLEVKSGIFGLIGGAIPTLLLFIWYIITK